MPCYEIQTMQINLELADKNILALALGAKLQAQGYVTKVDVYGNARIYVNQPFVDEIMTIDMRTGQATYSRYRAQEDIDKAVAAVKRAYGFQVIDEVASQGWEQEVGPEGEVYLTQGGAYDW